MPINDLIFRPAWFIATESIFEIVSLFITLIIAFYAWKIYKIGGNKKHKYMSLAFLAMSAGFFFKIVSNSIIIFLSFFAELTRDISWLKASHLYTGSLILYAFLILSGFVILSSLASNIKNKRIIASLLLIALMTAILIREGRSFTFFYFFAFLMLALYIVPYMHSNYKRLKSKSSYLVFLSFFLLAVSNFIFIWISAYGKDLYIIGHSIGLVGYLLLLINFILVLWKK